MDISKILSERKITLSLEISPARNEEAFEKQKLFLDKLAKLDLDFVSVTCHSSSEENNTVKVCEYLNKLGVNTVAHTTLNITNNYDNYLNDLKNLGTNNILALRGDNYDSNSNIFDLLESCNSNQVDFGVTGYPIAHPDSKGRLEDFKYLKKKVDAGAKYVITQLCFDDNLISEFLYDLKVNKIDTDVLVGVFPITSRNQLNRISTLTGINIPPKLQKIVDTFDSKDALIQASLIYSLSQILSLIVHGVKGIHLYTMNNYDLTISLLEQINRLIER